MSERESVVDYLWERTLAAWDLGHIDEASDCARFLEVLEGMSDVEYRGIYSGVTVAEAV